MQNSLLNNIASAIACPANTVVHQHNLIKVDMDLPTLLGTYFLSKPELKDKKDQLIEKAMDLFEESQKENMPAE